MTKKALLIGVSEYKELTRLPAAEKDVEALERVLNDPKIGAFDDVQLLPNPNAQKMRGAVAKLFANCKREDLILLFFSGHGVKDSSGNLHFATVDTEKDYATATAIPSKFIFNQMRESKSKRQVIILDCCYSGAALAGVLAKNAEVDVSSNIKGLADFDAVDVSSNIQDLGGEGRVVLTSSNSTQVSLTERELSTYTKYLVEGLETGAADKSINGFITAYELHQYVKHQVETAASRMNPEFYPSRQGFDINIARSLVNNGLKYQKRCEEAIEAAKKNNLLNLKESALQRKITGPFRPNLDDARNDLNIPPDEADEIERRVLKPYAERYEKLERYKSRYEQAVLRRFPLPDLEQAALDNYRRHNLQLEREDIKSVEEEVLANRENAKESYKKQFKQAAQQNRPFTNPTRNQTKALPERRWFKENEVSIIEQEICKQVYKEKKQLDSQAQEDLRKALGLREEDVKESPTRNSTRKYWFIASSVIAISGVFGFYYFHAPRLQCDPLPPPPSVTNQVNNFSGVSLPEGTFNVRGSTTWAQILSDKYLPGKKIKDVLKSKGFIVNSNQEGSQKGIQELMENNEISFALSSTPLNNEQGDNGLKEIEVGRDAIAIIVHPDLAIDGLTTAQLRDIYSGKTTNWNQLGGSDLEIKPFARGGGSGTVSGFRESILGNSDFSSNVDQSFSEITGNSGILNAIKATSGSISFVSRPEVQEGFAKIISIGDTPNNLVNLSDGYSEKYTSCLKRSLFVVVRDDNSNDQKAGEAYADFLRTKEGQNLLQDAGYGRIDEH